MTQTSADYSTIPQELRDRRQWVVWRFDTDAKTGEPGKVPYQTSGKRAKVNDAATWTTFDAAVDAADQWQGIGLVITADDPYCGIDLDNCIDDHGDLREWSQPIVAKLVNVSYGEISPSGSGIKFLTHGAKTDRSGNVKKFGDAKQQIEVYDGTNRKTGKPGHRWWAMTGDVYAGAESIGFGQPAIAKICDEHLMTTTRAAAKPSSNGKATTAKPSGTSVLERAAKYVARMDPSISGQRGHDKCYAAACVLVIGFDLSPSDALAILLEHFNPRCDPPWTEYELRHKIDDANNEPDARGTIRDSAAPLKFTIGSATMSGEAAKLPDDWLVQFRKQTHNFMATEFVRRFGDQVRYVPKWNKWLVWDGKRWMIDDRSTRTMRLVRVFAESLWDAMTAAAKTGLDGKEIAAINRVVKSMNSDNGIRAIVNLARADKRVITDHGDLDRDLHLINLANGTCDLEACELRPHDPADLITKLAGVSYGEIAECPEWDRTMFYALGGDQELIDYVHQIFGYAMSGRAGAAILPIAYGTGNNGKSTIWNCIMDLLGEYAAPASRSLLLGKKDDHDTVKADLFGKRLVVIPEPNQGDHLKESVVKELTGEKFITARRCGEDPWKFQRTCTFFMATNHMPKIAGTDQAIWRRLKKICFGQDFGKIEGLTVIEDFHDWLATHEGPGILNRLIDGYRRYVDAGRKFVDPISVIVQTEEYRAEEDPIGEFFAECIDQTEGTEVLARRVHGAYREWCETNGTAKADCLGPTLFKDAMVSRGVSHKKVSAGPNRNRYCYLDITIT